MRRSICYCEPHVALAGAVGTWRFIYQTSVPLAKGSRLKFDLQSCGRDIDWQVPSSDLKSSENVIYALLEDDKVLQAREVETPESFVPQYEFTMPAALKAGAKIIIVMGAPASKGKVKAKTQETGNAAQSTIQRRRPFLLYVDSKGNGNYEDPEVFTMDIRGNALHTIRILCPSFVMRNKRFDITLRFEDQYGNLTNMAPEGTLVDLSYQNLRENLNWKLFIPETGFVTLPNLYFNEIGIYRIRLQNMKTKELFVSPPIKCFSENPNYLFWGLLHGESERVDSTENIETCLRHLRDDRALNFVATSSFESIEETSNEIWKLISQNVATFNEEDRFASFLGFQWAGEPLTEGLRHIIYQKENKPILRRKEIKSNVLKKIYRSAAPKEFIAIPSFTMGKSTAWNFDDYTPEFERVIEIYNAWGSSECTAKEGNPYPITCAGKKGVTQKGVTQKGVTEYSEGSIQEALRKNCRFGFVAGGLDDRGVYADFFNGDQEQYTPGLTAIIAPKHTRDALIEALFNRSCYATTGERIILGLYLAGEPMGRELETKTKAGLMINRHLSGFVAGTAPLEKVEIIRNGAVIKTFKPDEESFDFTYDDMDELTDVVLPPVGESKPFVYYYLRVTQSDKHMAWSSPIWVDYHVLEGIVESKPQPVKKSRKK
jgi:hypothetical protein